MSEALTPVRSTLEDTSRDSPGRQSPHLKTGRVKALVGSNPTPSAYLHTHARPPDATIVRVLSVFLLPARRRAEGRDLRFFVALPVNVVLGQGERFGQVFLVHDVVPAKDAVGFVAADSHGDVLRYAGAHHVTDRGAPEIVKESAFVARLLARMKCILPGDPEGTQRLAAAMEDEGAFRTSKSGAVANQFEQLARQLEHAALLVLAAGAAQTDSPDLRIDIAPLERRNFALSPTRQEREAGSVEQSGDYHRFVGGIRLLWFAGARGARVRIARRQGGSRARRRPAVVRCTV